MFIHSEIVGHLPSLKKKTKKKTHQKNQSRFYYLRKMYHRQGFDMIFCFDDVAILWAQVQINYQVKSIINMDNGPPNKEQAQKNICIKNITAKHSKM